MKLMNKKFKLVIITLALVGLLGGLLAAFGSVSARSSGIISDTVPVMDLNDHGEVGIMNPQERGTSPFEKC